jgi:hypothetical protein
MMLLHTRYEVLPSRFDRQDLEKIKDTIFNSEDGSTIFFRKYRIILQDDMPTQTTTVW